MVSILTLVYSHTPLNTSGLLLDCYPCLLACERFEGKIYQLFEHLPCKTIDFSNLKKLDFPTLKGLTSKTVLGKVVKFDMERAPSDKSARSQEKSLL